MTGISLDGFNVTTIELQLVGNTGMSKTVKDHFREVVLLDQPVKRGFNG